jgi:hypothetical protein
MKSKIIFLICICGIISLQACGPKTLVSKGTLSAVNTPKNDVFIHPELREFLRKNPKPSIVLRVPTATGGITTTESEKIENYNSLYGRIEREFLKEGYTVRDRSLLEALVASGQNWSYKEIGEKIQTDIILEIVSITKNNLDKQSMDIQTEAKFLKNFKQHTASQQIQTTDAIEALERHLVIHHYIINCKIILVNSGSTVGMATFSYCRCDENFPLNIRAEIEFMGGYILRVKTEEDTRWYTSYSFGIQLETLSEMLANDLMKIFQGQ